MYAEFEPPPAEDVLARRRHVVVVVPFERAPPETVLTLDTFWPSRSFAAQASAEARRRRRRAARSARRASLSDSGAVAAQLGAAARQPSVPTGTSARSLSLHRRARRTR